MIRYASTVVVICIAAGIISAVIAMIIATYVLLIRLRRTAVVFVGR